MPRFIIISGQAENNGGGSPLYDLKACFGWGCRLHRGAEFKAVFADKTHRPTRTPVFTFYRRGNDCGHPRLGMAVSRRAAKKAVHRNRIKRSIRETFRQQQHALPNMDFVVTCAEQATAKAAPGEMSALLKRVWQEIAAAGSAARDRRG